MIGEAGKLGVTLAALLTLVAVDAGWPGAGTEGGGLAGAFSCVLRLENPDPGMGDGFGMSLVVHGNRLFVGAPGDDDAGPDAGAVYVFDAASLALERKILSPDGTPTASFGGGLAIAGGRLFVGPDVFAWGPWRVADVHAFDLESLEYAGAIPGFVEEARYATVVRFAAEGDTLAVASPPLDAPTPDGPRRVRLHDVESLAFRWGAENVPSAELTVDGHPQMGEDVAIDDAFVYVGQSHKTAKTGTVHVLNRSTGAEVTRLTRPDDTLHFGRGLLADGGTLYVGAGGTGSLHAYERGTWRYLGPLEAEGEANVEFGMVVARVGSFVAVPNSDRDGWAFHNRNPNAALHLFDRETRAHVRSLRPAEPTLGGGFGWAVAGDDARLFVGAHAGEGAVPRAGVVHVYEPRGPPGAACARLAPEALRQDCPAVDDYDGDGRFRNQEAAAGTDPCHPDSDGDRMPDGHEAFFGADPLDEDTDDDTLLDGPEMFWGIDATRADTDGDFFPDNVERDLGSDPRDPRSIPAVPVPLPPVPEHPLRRGSAGE